MEITIAGPLQQQGALAERILRALPDWFGIEESIRQYIREVEKLPTFVARVRQEDIGFLTLKQHYPCAAEVYVMGVLPEWHGHGAGSALVRAAEDDLRQQGVEYLQVKTLDERHPDPFYAQTRGFYLKMGFKPLESFDRIWGPENPCLLMVKALK